jgi:myosin tail region-interacting protein MTI1
MSLHDGARPQSKDGPPMMGTAPPLPLSRPGNMSLDTTTPVSPMMNDKRISRGPPPIPLSSPTVTSPQTRAPPPPPPGQPPSRRSTSDSHNITATKHQIDVDSEEEVTEYDGDYDTDIASSAKHKDALKSHGRNSSLDEESTLTDESQGKPSSVEAPGRTAPPLPPASAPRDMPPMPPQNTSKGPRQSAEMPRAAPPPVPPPKQPLEEDYDPFRYSSSQNKLDSQATTLQSPSEDVEEDDLYDATPVNTRAVPPSAPTERGLIGLQPSTVGPQPSFAAPQQSSDINRTKSQARRSMEQSRPTGEHGFIASDIDVAQSSYWWAQENLPPPSLQNRQDILYEVESSTSTKRGGKATVSKDVYVLYMDYSQSTITATFDAVEAHNVTFEQRHERPPPAPRQDQLESASSQFGARIAEAAHSRQNNTIGDGSPNAFVLDLIKPLAATGVLVPVGTRAYGALVYANLANASTQQFDEIRPGDVVTFRNAKFAGHKGTMHAKYATEAGRPGHDHVGVVLDWDGTKKKIRVLEQGREEAKAGKKGGNGKVHEDSYKVGDLKSGEVRVYRVMGRSWVGWDK